MSGLFGSLSQTVTALNAQARAVEVTGSNLANVNNASYSRQRVLIADRGSVQTPAGPKSLGVEAQAIQQLRDTLVDQQLSREIGRTAALTSESEANAKAQAALGESIQRTDGAQDVAASGSGLAGVVSDFFNAFQAFAARPTDLGERQNVVQRASILADRFQVTDARLAQLQDDLGTQIDSETVSTSDLLLSVAELNSQIGSLEINHPGTAVDLRDRRQAAIEKLAAKIGAETRPNSSQSGQVDVFVRDAAGDPIVLVSLASVTNDVAFDGTQLTAGTAATPIALGSGTIKGMLTARDTTIQNLRDSISDFAGQLADSVNSAYNPTDATGDLFTFNPASPSATLALVPGVTPVTLKSTDSSSAGDNTLASAVAALASTKFATASGDRIDGTFAQYYSGVVSGFGRTVSSTEGRLEDQKNIESLVRTQRQGISGVSMDEEMADLMKYQRAFEASSRMIGIIDGMLDVVVNQLVR
jgi:flagellar hook-associated protein 1 FlgK